MPTATEAKHHIQSQNGRTRRPLPSWIAKNTPSIYIYNIYPRVQKVPLGSLGTFYIPACEEGKAFSAPLIVPGIVGEEYDLADGQGNMGSTAIEGEKLASDIMGLNGMIKGCDLMTSNLEWHGCFISETAGKIAEANKHATGKDIKAIEPSAKELADAKKKVIQFMNLILKDGDSMNAKEETRKFLVPMHYEAASYLKQFRSWNTEPEQRTDCPACGTNIKPNLAVCPSCKAVLDPEKYAKYFPEARPEPRQEQRTPPTRA